MNTCTFCGKPAKNGLMLGPNLILCEDCIDAMHETVHTQINAKTTENIVVADKPETDNISNNVSNNIAEDFEIKTPHEIKAILDDYVIGQNDAKKTIAVGIYNHYKRIINDRDDIKKSNILLVGPTGVGKTELARTCAEILDVPFVICDATTVTESGYVGDDVENMLLRLYQAADEDIEATEHGIIYVDEIDKIARKGENTSITRDVSGEGVQQALLKIIEGADVDVPLSGGRKHPQGSRITINTSNILFICGGAFENITMSQHEDKTLGFCAENDMKEVDKNTEITPEVLTKQGIIPELIGRLPIIVRLNELEIKDLKAILTDTKNSLIKQYTDLLNLDNVKLTVDDAALNYIATQAYEKKTGARGLKSIIEGLMRDTMFDIPSEPDVKEVIVTVKNNKLTVNKKTDNVA